MSLELPESANAWTLDHLRRIVTTPGICEDHRFDFKSSFAVANSPKFREAVIADIASFANSAGGYLIFGVKDLLDNRGATEDELLPGVPDEDFPRLVSELVSTTKPPIPAAAVEVSNPAIQVRSGRFVLIVRVRPSPKGLHAVGNHEEGLRWPTRANGHLRWLDANEVQDALVLRREGLSTLKTLVAELETIIERARAMDVRFHEFPGAKGELGSIHLPDVQPIASSIIHELRMKLPDVGERTGEVRRHLATLEAELDGFNEQTQRIGEALERIDYKRIAHHTGLAKERHWRAARAADDGLYLLRSYLQSLEK